MFADQMTGNPSGYLMLITTRIRGGPRVSALRRALRALVDRHEILRTSVVMVDDRPVVVMRPTGELTLTETTLPVRVRDGYRARAGQMTWTVSERMERRRSVPSSRPPTGSRAASSRQPEVGWSEADGGPAWREATDSGEIVGRLTPECLVAMRDEIQEVVQRYDLRDDTVDDAEPLVVVLRAYPRRVPQ